jgi:hypothetical protein
LEESPDVAGEVALEAADGFAGGLAFRLAPRDVVARLGVAAGAGDDDAVQRGVDLAVAALVEALSPGVARAGGDRRDPGGAGELGRCGKPLRAGDLADELGRGEGPEPGLGEQLRSDLGDQGGDLALECLDRPGELADAPQFVARDADARRLLGPGEPPGDPGCPAAVEQRAAGQFKLGPRLSDELCVRRGRLVSCQSGSRSPKWILRPRSAPVQW